MATSIITNLYWNTLLRIPVQIVCVALSFIIASLLEPSDFGIMAIGMMVVGYANLITNFGLNEAIIQRSIVCKRTINSIFAVDFLISFLLAVLFLLFAKDIATFFNEPNCTPVIQFLAVYFIITSFSGVAHAILRRDLNFTTLSKLEALKNLLSSLLTVTLAFYGFGYWSLVFGQIVPLVMFTIAVCIKAQWFPGVEYSYLSLKPVFNFGFWNFIKSQLGYFVAHFDMLLIGRVIGTWQLGLYDKSMSIAKVPRESILMNINSVMFSAFSKNKNNKLVVVEQFRKSMALVCLISYPLYGGLILVAPHIVHVLLGEKWLGMIMPFRLILFAHLFKSFGGLMASVNVGLGEYKRHTQRLFLSSIIFIISCLVLIRYGLLGIAFAFVIFCMVEFGLSLSLSMSILKVKCNSIVSCLFAVIWSTVVMSIVVVYFSVTFMYEYTYLNVCLLIFCGFSVYVICIILDRSKMCLFIKKKIHSDVLAYIGRGYHSNYNG